jgi:hypothetical protein
MGYFSLHHRVQTSSRAHPASYPTGTRAVFRGVKLTTYLHLVPRSRMHGAILPLSNTPSWRDAQLKQRGHFTFTLHDTLAYTSLYCV